MGESELDLFQALLRFARHHGHERELADGEGVVGRHGDGGVGLILRAVELALKGQSNSREPMRQPLDLRRQVVLSRILRGRRRPCPRLRDTGLA
jgi:hypothetical protein